MTARQWYAGTLLKISGSYWEACTLHAGVKLAVFSHLNDTALSAGQVADKINADERSVGFLLDALCAMDLLVKKDGQYGVTEASRRYLVKSSPDYVGHMIMHHHHLAASWTALADAVVTGEPVRNRQKRSLPERREAFLMGMYTLASLQAPDIVRQIDLGDRKRLLDLGGGPGTYAVAFCGHYSQLQAVVFDLHTTRPFAEKTIAASGYGDRIVFYPGDYRQEALPGGFDVVWMSHILHAEGEQACMELVGKAAGVLEPGGIILIQDFYLNNNTDGPLFPALFALNMLLGTEKGQAYSEQQVCAMLEKAGIVDIRREAYQGPTQSGIISGRKP